MKTSDAVCVGVGVGVCVGVCVGVYVGECVAVCVAVCVAECVAVWSSERHKRKTHIEVTGFASQEKTLKKSQRCQNKNSADGLPNQYKSPLALSISLSLQKTNIDSSKITTNMVKKIAYLSQNKNRLPFSTEKIA